MLSHNMGLWEPMHGNKKLVTDTLRNRFGLLGGYTGSDMGNVMQLARNYGFAKDGPTAVRLAMEAGLDQNMGGQYVTYTKAVVESGELSNATLDRAVGNILRKKFATGLFDAGPIDPSGVAVVDSSAHRALALEAAREGLVLLKNSPVGGTNGGTEEPQQQKAPLPVDMTAVKSVAVIGQLGGCGAANSTACTAKVSMLGGYTAGRISGAGIQVVSIEEAFRGRGYNTTWVQGVSATNGQTADDAAVGIASAVEAAIAADLTVIAVGCVGCTCCNECGCGEAGDRQSFDLEGQQLALLSAVLNATAVHGKQVVAVTICGRPVTFGEGNAILDRVPALISAFRPGEEGGNAIADLITGAYNPSGTTRFLLQTAAASASTAATCCCCC
jgi:beta-glucosidase